RGRNLARRPRALRAGRRFSLRRLLRRRRLLLPGCLPLPDLRGCARRQRRGLRTRLARVAGDAGLGAGRGARERTRSRIRCAAIECAAAMSEGRVEVSDVPSAWQERIRQAAAADTLLRIVGRGTKDFYGQELCGEPFETVAYAGVVDYDPTELVITARCGTPLADIEQTLRAEGQMLGFEPPQFGRAATLGGCVAAGLAGPRRPYAGAVRDLVLGVRLLDGRGEDLSFGGRVMKNVAGFDVSRVVAGSLGTLGVVLEVSLKCQPLPRVEASRVFELTAERAIERMNEWGGQPLPVTATCHHAGRLHVRFAGAPSAVSAAERQVGGEPCAAAEAFWCALRDQEHAFF